MFIRRKTYNELIEQKNDFERIASKAVAQNGRLLDQWKETLAEMKDIQAFNHSLIDRNEELLTRIKELDAEKEGLELRVAILNTDYDALDYEHVRVCRETEALREERDHYEERCRYLEGEVEDLEERVAAFEEGKAISREAE